MISLQMFEVSELSMKFERHLDAEIVQLQFLSENFHKMVLRANEFHYN